MKVFIVLMGLFFGSLAHAQSQDNLSQVYAPAIVGDTLYIKGKIDSHIYDFLSYEAQKVEAVTYVSLNSYGGNHYWAKEIGRRLQEFGKITVLSAGNVCASACLYIFGSGTERWMSENTWLGIHGARLGAGYTVNFINDCFDIDGNIATLNESKDGCQNFISHWYSVAYTETRLAFQLIETAGVSPALFENYFKLDQDPNWFQHSNVLKIKDWEVTPQEALEFNLATQIIDKSASDILMSEALLQ